MEKRKAFLIIIVAGFLLFYISSDPTEDDLVEISANVTEIIDGDTVVLGSGERVRLMGIDATEVGEECSQEATVWLEKKIMDREVVLEVLGDDVYGRKLAYIFKDGLHISDEMVSRGLAYTYYFDTDERYIEELVESERKAIDRNKGCLWKNSINDPDDSIYACESSDYVSEIMVVEGKIEEVNRGEGIIYLNFEGEYPDNCFSAIVWEDYKDRFSRSLDRFENSTVRVEGLVTTYRGDPQMELRDEYQIQPV